MQGTWQSVGTRVRLDQGKVKWESVTVGVGLKTQLLPWESRCCRGTQGDEDLENLMPNTWDSKNRLEA